MFEKRSFFPFFWLFLFAAGLPLVGQGANLTTLGSGNWHDPAIWGGSVPGTGDQVTVATGHVVQIQPNNPVVQISALQIEAGGILYLTKENFQVSGSTTILGRLEDMERDGVNTFQGLFALGGSGKALFDKVTGQFNYCGFEGGIQSAGDSLLLRNCRMLANNQDLSGSSPIVMKDGSMVIGDGLTVSNHNTGGFEIDNGLFNGETVASLFRNHGLLIIRNRWEMMPLGSVDFSPAGNEVRYSRIGDQDIRGGDYARLIIEPDPTGPFRRRSLNGAVTVSEWLEVAPLAKLELKSFSIDCSGDAMVHGELNDAELPGLNTFEDFTLTGTMKGAWGNGGQYTIAGDFVVAGPQAEITEMSLDLQGTATIQTGATLTVKSNDGPRVFRNTVIEAGGMLVVDCDEGLEFAGPLLNQGQMIVKEALITGEIQHQGDSLHFFKARISGVNATFSGSKPIYLKNELTIDSAAVLTNTNQAGFYLYDRGKLIGLTESSTFRNQAEVHDQTNNLHMEVGLLDSDYPGSAFYYDRPGDGQKMSPGRYYDLFVPGGTENNIRKMFLEDDTIRVSHRLEIGRYTKLEPKTGSVLSEGTAVVNGEIFDGDPAGAMEFQDLDFSYGRYGGLNWSWGTLLIKGELSLDSADAEINSVDLTVDGHIRIGDGSKLVITSRSGYRDFGDLRIEAGGIFSDETSGDTLYFSGVIRNEGTFSVDYPVLMGVLEHEGDSIRMFNPIFQGTPQLSGSKPLVLKNLSYIEANSQVTSYLDSLIFAEDAELEGADASAVFVNLGTMFWLEKEPFLQTGTFDPSQGPNRVVYDFPANLDLRSGEYWHLELPANPGRPLAKRKVVSGGITCLGDLYVAPDIEFQPSFQDVDVRGTAYFHGKIYDNELDGLFTARRISVRESYIDGSATNRYGSFLVEEEFYVEAGETRWERADLEVLGVVTVADSGILELNTLFGDRKFHHITVEKGGLLLENSNGGTYIITGDVTVAGELSLGLGDYDFGGKITILPEGEMYATRQGNTYGFSDSIHVDGTLTIPVGACTLRGPLSGPGSFVLESEATLPAGDTLVNNMDGEGFSLKAALLAENGTGHFVNRGILRYGPRSNAPFLDGGGTYDFFSVPDNWVIFDGTTGYQPVPAIDFRNVGFENGNNKAIMGDSLRVHGDLWTRVELRKDPNVFSSGVIHLVGTGDQTLDGFGVGAVENMVVQKPTGKLVAQTDFAIKEGLVMKTGILLANPGVIGISGNGFIQERDNSYILGRVGSERDINQNQNREFGGMGISIRPRGANMGPTLVYRVTGESLLPGQINRYFEVFPTNNDNLDATVKLGYHERELNGAVETDLQMVHQPFPEDEFEVLGGRTFRISNAVEKINIDRMGRFSLYPESMAVNAFPNPFFTQKVSVSFVLAEEDPAVDVKIFDRAGRVWSHQTVVGEPGLNVVEFQDLNLAGGIYFARVVAGDRKGVKAMLCVSE